MILAEASRDTELPLLAPKGTGLPIPRFSMSQTKERTFGAAGRIDTYCNGH
jgi:hypothetical protein